VLKQSVFSPGHDLAPGLRINLARSSDMISGFCHLSVTSLGICQAGAKMLLCLLSTPAQNQTQIFQSRRQHNTSSILLIGKKRFSKSCCPWGRLDLGKASACVHGLGSKPGSHIFCNPSMGCRAAGRALGCLSHSPSCFAVPLLVFDSVLQMMEPASIFCSHP